MTDAHAAETTAPSATWLLCALLGNQVLLYLSIPVLARPPIGPPAEPWVFYTFTALNSGLMACLLLEFRHWVHQRTTHIALWLIWLDTAIEGAIQPALVARDALKPVHVNLYCVAAFAGVYIIWLAYCRLWQKCAP